MWSELFILISALICIVIVFKSYKSDAGDVKLTILTSCFFWVSSELTQTFTTEPWLFIPELLQITAISVLLVAQLMIIRRLRPILFRYPYVIVYTPLILPVSFVIVMEISIMKDVFLFVSLFSAFFVYLALCIGYPTRTRGIFYQSVTIIILLGSFLIATFVSTWIENIDWLWRLCLALGMIMAVLNFSGIVDESLDQ